MNAMSRVWQHTNLRQKQVQHTTESAHITSLDINKLLKLVFDMDLFYIYSTFTQSLMNNRFIVPLTIQYPKTSDSGSPQSPCTVAPPATVTKKSVNPHAHFFLFQHLIFHLALRGQCQHETPQFTSPDLLSSTDSYINYTYGTRQGRDGE